MPVKGRSQADDWLAELKSSWHLFVSWINKISIGSSHSWIWTWWNCPSHFCSTAKKLFIRANQAGFPCILKEIAREKGLEKIHTTSLEPLGADESENSEFRIYKGNGYILCHIPSRVCILKHMKILVNRDEFISLKSVQFSSNLATKCICAKSPKTNKTLFF